MVGEYAYVDGRASAEENFEERTGIARGNGSGYIAVAGPASSPFGGGALRYVSAIELPAGLRLYYESATKYGSPELCTELIVQPCAACSLLRASVAWRSANAPNPPPAPPPTPPNT